MKIQIEFDMDDNGKICGINKIGEGGEGVPQTDPMPPNTDILVMSYTKNTGMICFWWGGRWICF